MIYIKLLSASFIRIDCLDEAVIIDIYENYKFHKPNFTQNRFTKWDGVIRLFNKKTRKLPFGLLNNFIELCNKRGYEYKLDTKFKALMTSITRETTQSFVDSLDLPYTLHPHQFDILYNLTKNNRVVAKAATSAGKSLSTYTLAQYYHKEIEDCKTLIIVPTVMLVEQLYTDFKSYSVNNKFNVDKMVHKVHEGVSPYTAKPMVISTWQSLLNIKDNEYFEQYDVVIVDECHLASGDSITGILEKCTNAYVRFGLTGTIKTDKLHPLQVMAGIGHIKEFVKARELIDKGMATDIKVNIIKLNYDKQTRFDASQVLNTYQKEILFLLKNEKRNNVIVEAAKNLKGNSLFLFDRVDKHLMHLKECMEKTVKNKTIVVITGSVKGDDREAIKKAIEVGDDIVLLATFGTVSTGVSINKLHNLVFCHPTKSIVRTLQSLGRLMRMHESKEVATIYDIIDDLRMRDYTNKTFLHGLERKGYYDTEKHPYTIKQIEL